VLLLRDLNLHDQISEFTTSLLYDRGGTGWSDPVDLPRTCTEVAGELRDLLQAAQLPGPCSGRPLVGRALRPPVHPTFPDEVAGMVRLELPYNTLRSSIRLQSVQRADEPAPRNATACPEPR
jgi:hypothetical protein